MRDTISWPPRDASQRGSAFLGIVVVAVLIAVVTFAYSAARGGASAASPAVPATAAGTAEAVPAKSDPRGFLAPSGAPVIRGSGLRLVVADPPALLDVANGETTPVPGLATDRPGVYDVLSVGGTAVFVRTRACLDCMPSGEAFVLRDGRAVSLGPAWSVAPSLDGRGVWILSYVDTRRCVLREVGLDGHARRPERPIDCRARLRKETPAGLLVDVAARTYGPPDSALLDPATGGALGRYPRIDAVTEHFTLTQLTQAGRQSHPGTPARTAAAGVARAAPPSGFVLTDLQRGTQHPLPWPSRLDRTGESALDPSGRFLAVAFANPEASEAQRRVDIWVLDTAARRWRQVPGMPARTTLERTSMAWAPDGRLVILGHFDGLGDLVAAWLPGPDPPAVRRVELPSDRVGSSFTVLSPPHRD